MRQFLIAPSLLLLINICVAQENKTVVEKITEMPQRFLTSLRKKTEKAEAKLDKKTEQYLQKFEKQEARLQKAIAKKDSLLAIKLFSESEVKFEKLRNDLNIKNSSITKLTSYFPHLDTLKTSLKFLEQYENLVKQTKDMRTQLQGSVSNIKSIETKLQQTELIKQYIKQRRQELNEKLQNTVFAKNLKRYSKQYYYYTQELNEIKNLLNDSKKIEQKTISLLRKLPVFQKFLREHSELASLFVLPNAEGVAEIMPGLQTRSDVLDLIQQQFAGGGTNMPETIEQNLQSAQSQLNTLKQKLLKSGGSSSDDEIPEGKYNKEKGKSFKKRLVLGTDFQTIKANRFWVSTLDIGLSLGYKINQNSVIGIGSSGKLGLGNGFKAIALSAEGLSLRSFVDIKLKGSFWLSGGFEYNYQPVITDISRLYTVSNWQRSGLLGISKIIDTRTKFLKKTKVQLLWDMLSYAQAPRTVPIKFRVGYNF